MLLQDLAQAEVTQLDGKDNILDRLRFMFTESNFEENSEEIETIQELLLNNDLAYDSNECYDIKEALWNARQKQDQDKRIRVENDFEEKGSQTERERPTNTEETCFDGESSEDQTSNGTQVCALNRFIFCYERP